MTFYLNDCIPDNASEAVLVSTLDSSLREYLYVLSKNREQVDGIVTQNTVELINLNQNRLTLQVCLSKLKKDIRGIAYRIFGKYPIREFFPEGDDMEILERDYKITINAVEYSAINPAITFHNDGCLFTLKLHNELAKNYLILLDAERKEYKVLNLYGERENSDFIDGIIKKQIAEGLNNYDGFCQMVNAVMSGKATKQFRALSTQMQQVVMGHFSDAIRNNNGRNFTNDGDLVKEVERTKCNHAVFEIRIFSPIAFRIYFSCKNDRIFINSIERKPATKVQDADIKAAKKGIETMFAENPGI